jgi:hypothetical protein
MCHLTIAQSQTLKPELLSVPAGTKPSHATYALGSVGGLPTFALVALAMRSGANNATSTEAPPVCAAHKLLVQANKGTEIDTAMQQALLAYMAHCEQKILAGKQPQGEAPRLRRSMLVEQYDAAGIQRTVGEDRGNSLYARSFQFADLPGGTAALERTAEDTKQNTALKAEIAPMQPTLQANAARLKSWFTTHRISAFTALPDIARNPFAYEQQTVLTIANFNQANSASEVELTPPVSRNTYASDNGTILLQSTAAKDWREGSYLVVMQVQGRNPAVKHQQALAKALQHIACKDYDCRDLLMTPDATSTMVELFRFGMKY